jgi:predicted ArsR family transcriptional regulator
VQFVGSPSLMTTTASSNSLNWEALARLETHHRRVAILEILALDGGRTLSVNEIAQELQFTTSDAYYHVSRLAPGGLLRLAFTLPVRGTIEHFYCLAGHSADDLFERLGLPPGANRRR